MFPHDCAGSKQSPVDISFGSDVIREGALSMKWTNYENPPQTMTLTNNGHSGINLINLYQNTFY